MASLGHIAIGLAAARLYVHMYKNEKERRPSLGVTMAWMSVLALLPDADVVAFKLGIPYWAPFGHRGASHSLVAALLCGVLCAGLWALAKRGARRSLLAGAFAGVVVATHGLLDSLTDGGLGVALRWPFSEERYFAPWRPIPVAPIGARLLSMRGLRVMGTELVYFLPLLVYGLWPRRRG